MEVGGQLLLVVTLPLGESAPGDKWIEGRVDRWVVQDASY